MAKRLGLRAAAREIGIAHTSLLSAVKLGHVKKGSDGKYDMDEVQRWRENIDPEDMVRGEMEKARHNTTSKPSAKSGRNGGGSGGSGGDGQLEGQKLIKVKTHEAVYKAKKAELEYKKMAGELVPLEDVTDTVMEIGKKLQTRVRGWKPRFMAHMTDTGKKTVQDELDALLDEIEKDLLNVSESLDH